MTHVVPETFPEEAQALRRCVRELTGLSVLSAVWVRSGPREIAEGLGVVLSRSLPLELVYVRVAGLGGEDPVEVARTAQGLLPPGATRALADSFGSELEQGRSDQVMTIPSPTGRGNLRLAAIPIGFDGDCGMVVAGSEQPGFPGQTDRLILNVAANQAAIVLQQMRSESQLRRREQELSDFFDNASVGLHWVGPDGIILRANQAELDLLGYSADEYIGHHISEFHADADVIEDILRRLSAGEVLQGYQARLRCKDGSILNVVIDSSVLWENGKFVHTRCFTRNVTDQMRAEAALREREAWLSGQSEAHEAALNEAPLETSLGILVRTATGLLGPGVRAAFYLANPEGTALHHVVGMEPGYAAAVDGFPIGPDSLSCGLAAHTGQPILTSDVQAEPLWAEWRWLAAQYDFRGCWSFPIHTTARKYAGTLAVYWREPREATPRDVEFLTQVSQAAAIVIARHQEAENRGRAQAAERKQTERLRLLWEAAEVLLRADDPDTMLGGLLGQIGTHLGVDTYFNYLVNETGDALRLAFYDGIPARTARSISRIELGQAICGAVALERRSMVANRIQQSDDPRVQLVKSLGIRAYACNPLLAGDRLLGTLSFASRTRDEFDPDEVAFIETICHYVTMAYERLRLLSELKEADRRKDEFLATLAHELRNPLAPVRNAVKIIGMNGSEAPQSRWCRDVIERQVEHLSRLIDDLLDISRITRNRLELRKQRVELAEVITGAVESSRPLIEQYGHHLTVTLPPEPVYLNGDVVRLAQVFLNLLNNAAKYTDQGGRIWLIAERQGEEAVVRVRDTGVGIPPEKMPRLFEMFYQVDRSLEKSQGGLGIGLSLVRRLVELHGGSVKARSEGTGKGTEFIVRLPVLAEELEPARARGEDTNGHSGAGVSRRILVVDDNRDSADSIAMLLRLTGSDIHTAYDGVQGVEAAEQLRPDVVLLDIGMPRLNGEEACRRIRSAAWGRRMTLIALTGWGQEEDRQRCLNAGFDHHLTKPVDFPTLLELLDSPGDRQNGRPAGPAVGSN